jgi:hypothetical protein
MPRPPGITPEGPHNFSNKRLSDGRPSAAVRSAAYNYH